MPETDDFAPGGSERRRTGRGPKPENLPPGRRNRTVEKPVSPDVHGPAESKKTTPDGPRTRARAEAARLRAEAAAPPDAETVAAALTRAAAIAPRGKLTPIAPPEPEEDESLLDEPDPWEEGRRLVASIRDPLAELQIALMYGLRLRILGEGDDSGTWEDFDQIAADALRLSAPDPLEAMTPAQRFLWGEGGLDTYERLDSPQLADVADIITLGSPE